MKKWSLLPLIALIAFSLTGCFDIVEEVHLNKDGSGKYNITMDMSSLMSDGFMKGMLKEQMSQGTDEEGEKAPMEKDTMMYFKDDPGFANASPQEKKILEKVAMHMSMSESKEEMLIDISFPFNKLSEIAELTQAMQKIEGNKQLGGLMGSGGMMPGGESKFLLKKGLLTRTPMPKPEKDSENDEAMDMMKMFLGSASYKTIYHLPGKVKKVTIPNAETDGSTVTITNSLLDLIEGKAKIDGDIKFK